MPPVMPAPLVILLVLVAVVAGLNPNRSQFGWFL